ncbi:MAG: sigma-70 family RNA polymerase sigma factor [Akkermansia sp.]|nr:sigma-70 family RNA polymerase sigma factor [Akkermansia sp.]
MGNTPEYTESMEQPAEKSYICAESGKINWESWLDDHGSRLLLYARQQTRSEADAEDVLQDALVQLVRAVESGDFRGNEGQWYSYALTAIRHRAMDAGRRAQVRRNYAEAQKDNGEGICEETPWLSSGADDEYLRRQVEKLLRKLPPEFAEVVVLKIWDGLTFQQIADTTGVPMPTVCSRYRYALKKMREVLETTPIED